MAGEGNGVYLQVLCTEAKGGEGWDKPEGPANRSTSPGSIGDTPRLVGTGQE